MLFNRHRVSVLQNELVLEMDSSDNSRVWIHFIPMYFIIATMNKVAKIATFMVYDVAIINVFVKRKTQSSWNMANLNEVICHYLMLP